MNDPLTDRWISCWIAMRNLRTAEIDGWPLLHVRTASRQSELICVDPGVAELRTLLPHIAGDPVAMLTVVGTDLSCYRAMSLPEDVRVSRDDETLMTASVDQIDVPAMPHGLAASWDTAGHVAHYRVEDGERVVAEGTMGIDDGWATFDNVETAPSHRRRGLGRHVMSILLTHAHRSGARHAVLAASADGRALYESLGWSVERELLSLMGSPGR